MPELENPKEHSITVLSDSELKFAGGAYNRPGSDCIQTVQYDGIQVTFVEYCITPTPIYTGPGDFYVSAGGGYA